MLARPATAPTLAAAARARRSRGFTLVEIIVVITVIAILLALLFPAVRSAIGSSHARSTKAVIAQVALAVDQFQDIHGRYPYSATGSATLGAQALVEELGSMLRTKDTFVPNVDGARVLVDAWGQPILYVRYISSAEVEKHGEPPDQAMPRPIRNRKSYDIFSAGKFLAESQHIDPITTSFQTLALEPGSNNKYKYDGMTFEGQVNDYLGNW